MRPALPSHEIASQINWPACLPACLAAIGTRPRFARLIRFVQRDKNGTSSVRLAPVPLKKRVMSESRWRQTFYSRHFI